MKKKIRLRIRQIWILLKYGIYKALNLFWKQSNSVWLIAERGDEARDNGFALYEYMIREHPEIDVRYVIEKSSPDIKKFKDKSRIVYYGSKEHFKLFFNAEYLISTHIMGYSPEFRIFNKLDRKGLIKVPGKRIYLTHGIDKDNVEGLKVNNIKVDMFVCGARPQYDFELKELRHPDGVLQYTGMPRFDNLKNHIKRQILLMPTWRTWLFYCDNINEFKKTNYYKNWDALLRNKELTKWLEDNEVQLIFYPHYEIQPLINAFSGYSDRVTIADFAHYDVQTLLNESLMMVTDYSSVAFDFAYLEKPVLYYQFDLERHDKEHFGKGYFDTKRDGFGEVVLDNKEVYERIIGYAKCGFNMPVEYKKRKDEWFTYHDRKNCERVYQAIIRAKAHYGGNKNAS